jgi:hypothetical protein
MTAFKTTTTTVDHDSIWCGSNYMDLVDPNPAEIRFADIARALSRLCRYTGHGRHFYSVAEHSVHCVRAFAAHAAGDIYTDPWLRDIARDILMHDAAEAYLGDVASPLKRLLPDYRRLEKRMEAAIAARFDLAGAAPEWVKRCDLEMLAREKADLMPTAGVWPVIANVAPPCLSLWYLDPEEAEHEFTEMARALGLSGIEEISQ